MAAVVANHCGSLESQIGPKILVRHSPIQTRTSMIGMAIGIVHFWNRTSNPHFAKPSIVNLKIDDLEIDTCIVVLSMPPDPEFQDTTTMWTMMALVVVVVAVRHLCSTLLVQLLFLPSLLSPMIRGCHIRPYVHGCVYIYIYIYNTIGIHDHWIATRFGGKIF